MKKTSPELKRLINSSFVDGEFGVVPNTIDGDVTRLNSNSESIQEHILREEILVAFIGKKLVENRGVTSIFFCNNSTFDLTKIRNWADTESFFMF